MNVHDEYKRGYQDGYRSIVGANPESYPPTPTFLGGSMYELGKEAGREAGAKLRSSPPANSH